MCITATNTRQHLGNNVDLGMLAKNLVFLYFVDGVCSHNAKQYNYAKSKSIRAKAGFDDEEEGGEWSDDEQWGEDFDDDEMGGYEQYDDDDYQNPDSEYEE